MIQNISSTFVPTALVVGHAMFSSLHSSERVLVNLIQDLGFGLIDELGVADHLPTYNPTPQVYQTARVEADMRFDDPGTWQLRDTGCDFLLKNKFVFLLNKTRTMSTATTISITVQDGQPFTVRRQLSFTGAAGNCSFGASVTCFTPDN